MTLNELKNQIGRWSLINFGDNGMGEFKHLRPVLGIIEEIFEYEDAAEKSLPMDEQVDALADTGIYALDLCYQIGVEVPDYENSTVDIYFWKNIPRIFLKRIQGIRGYDKDDFYNEEVKAALESLFKFLDTLAAFHDTTIEQEIAATWQKVVSNRNWVENKDTGV